MDTTQAMDLMRDAVGIAIKLASPMLLLSMIVGVVVAIFKRSHRFMSRRSPLCSS